MRLNHPNIWRRLARRLMVFAAQAPGVVRPETPTDPERSPAIVQSTVGAMLLEQRFMFDGDAAQQASEIVSFDPPVEDTEPSKLETQWQTQQAAPLKSPDQQDGETEAGNTAAAAPTQLRTVGTERLAADVLDAWEEALAQANEMLTALPERADSTALLTEVFGQAGTDPSVFGDALESLKHALRHGGLNIDVELRPGEELQGATAAYARMGQTGSERIYVNADWINAGAEQESIRLALLEEFGHALDQRLNAGLDSPGDEGEWFAARISGHTISEQELSALAADDDRGSLVINGTRIDVELASIRGPSTLTTYTEGGTPVALQAGIVVTPVKSGSGKTAVEESVNDFILIFLETRSTDILALAGAVTSVNGTAADLANGLSLQGTNQTEPVVFFIGTQQYKYTLNNTGGNTTLTVQQIGAAAGSASASAIQSALRAVQYSSTDIDPASTARNLSWEIRGVNSAPTSIPWTQTLSITPVNDAPTLSVSASPSPTFYEGGTGTQSRQGNAVALFEQAAINTVEAGQGIASLRLTVSGLKDGANEKLLVDGTAIALTTGTGTTTGDAKLSFSVSLSGSTATLTLSKTGAGLSTAAMEAIIKGLRYQNTAVDAPTPGSRTVTLTSLQDTGGVITSGKTTLGADTTTLTIASSVEVVAVNDAPSAMGDVSRNTYVGGSLKLTESSFGFRDVDGNSFLAVMIDTAVQSGALMVRESTPIVGATGTLHDATDILVSAYSGSLEGTATQGSYTVDSAHYTLKMDGRYGTLYLNPGTGAYVYQLLRVGEPATPSYIAAYEQVNDEWAPTYSSLAAAGLTAFDEAFLVRVGSGTDTRTLNFVASNVAGQWVVNHEVEKTAVSGDFITVSDIAAGKVRFSPYHSGVIRYKLDGGFIEDPTPNLTSFTSFTYRVQDNGGTANNGVNLSVVSYRYSFNLIGNLGPVVEVPDDQFILEDNSLSFGSALRVNYTGTDQIRVTLSLASESRGGSLGGLTGNLGGVTIESISGNGNNFTQAILRGTASSLNTQLARVSFTPGANQFSALDDAARTPVPGQGIGSSHTYAIVELRAQNIPAADGIAYPADFKNIDIVVRAVNDAPTLASAVATLPAVVQGDAAVPTSIATLFGASFSDAADGALADSLQAVAVFGTANASKGQWQYRLATSEDWQDLTASTSATALVLGAADALRFVAAEGFAGSAPVLQAALIETGHTAGDPSLTITPGSALNLDTTSRGGSSRISAGNVTLTHIVTPTAELVEDVAVVNSQQIVSGTFALSDLTFSTPTTPVGTVLGRLRITPNGDWTYEVSNAAIQFLAAGETVVDVFNVTASNGTTYPIRITLTGINDTPVLASPSATGLGRTLEEGSDALSANGTLTFTDADLSDRPSASEALTTVVLNGQPLTLDSDLAIALANAFSIATPSSNTQAGVVNWSFAIAEDAIDELAAGDELTAAFAVTLSDGNGGTDTETVTIVVRGTNDAPVLASIGNKTVNEGQLLTFTATATDVDSPANTLTFSLAAAEGGSVPTGAAITSAGVFTWTPTEEQGPGAYTFIVQVSDGTATVSETVTVNVNKVTKMNWGQGAEALNVGLSVDNSLKLENVGLAANVPSPTAAPEIQALVAAGDLSFPVGMGALAFSIAPADGFAGLADVDPLRSGTQVVLELDLSALGLKAGDLNGYLKFISLEVIESANGILTDLDGNAVTLPGWYDFTQRAPGGDGAQFVLDGDRIVGVRLVITDNRFGDNNPLNNVITDPGLFYRIERGVTLPPGIISETVDVPPSSKPIAQPPFIQQPQSQHLSPNNHPTAWASGGYADSPQAWFTSSASSRWNSFAETLASDTGFGLWDGMDQGNSETEEEAAWRVTVIPDMPGHLGVLRGVNDQYIASGVETAIPIPRDTFAHTDPSALVELVAMQASGEPLPSWIWLDSKGVLRVMPPKGQAGEWVMRLVVRDGFGREASTLLRLHVDTLRPTPAMNREPTHFGAHSLTTQLRHAAWSRQPGWADLQSQSPAIRVEAALRR
jgi:VCBS repeat-containing protein